LAIVFGDTTVDTDELTDTFASLAAASLVAALDVRCSAASARSTDVTAFSDDAREAAADNSVLQASEAGEFAPLSLVVGCKSMD
jgi:hypothetical protein